MRIAELKEENSQLKRQLEAATDGASRKKDERYEQEIQDLKKKVNKYRKKAEKQLSVKGRDDAFTKPATPRTLSNMQSRLKSLESEHAARQQKQAAAREWLGTTQGSVQCVEVSLDCGLVSWESPSTPLPGMASSCLD